MKLYLAGGLFNVAERCHILNLEDRLKRFGHELILPQREALKFHDPSTGKFHVPSIVTDCRKAVENPANLGVFCGDGPIGDDGTAIEFGHAMTATGRAIVYRTDFRTDLEREVGVNAMWQQEGSIFIYYPCFVTELDQVSTYYGELAQRIHEATAKILLAA